MFREQSPNPEDSGWRAYSGTESPQETNSPDHLAQRPLVSLIADDASIDSITDEDPPCAFERERQSQQFRRTRLRFKKIPAV
jgi:hypothetical protein